MLPWQHFSAAPSPPPSGPATGLSWPGRASQDTRHRSSRSCPSQLVLPEVVTAGSGAWCAREGEPLAASVFRSTLPPRWVLCHAHLTLRGGVGLSAGESRISCARPCSFTWATGVAACSGDESARFYLQLFTPSGFLVWPANGQSPVRGAKLCIRVRPSAHLQQCLLPGELQCLGQLGPLGLAALGFESPCLLGLWPPSPPRLGR